jgi:hypothetical protein
VLAGIDQLEVDAEQLRVVRALQVWQCPPIELGRRVNPRELRQARLAILTPG